MELAVLPLLGPRLQHFLSAAGMPGLFIEGCNTCFLGLLWGPRGFFAQLLPQSSGPQGSASGRPVLLGRAQGSVAPSFQAPAWLPPFVSFFLGFGHAIITICKGS